MKKVAIIAYPAKRGVKEITGRLVNWLKDNNIDFAVPQSDAPELNLSQFGVPDDKVFEGADLAISLGGDGTTLRAVRLMGERTIPMLGVNLGEMGFLMWVMPDELEHALDLIKDERFRIEERRMLRSRTEVEGGSQIERLALNDILIGREEFGRLAKFDVYVNDTHFCRYAADGIVVATPTGSTAYSFSAGGPIISPTTEAFVLTPICPHTLNNRSLVFNFSDRLAIKPYPAEIGGKVGVSIDGNAIQDLARIDNMEIILAEQTAKFISLNGHGFYQALGGKLKKWLNLT